jgi:hypothetical protein
MESADNKEGVQNSESRFKQEIHSKVIRAGKRTYFFDVKSTRNDEYYLTITESKKRFADNGKFSYEKHKIFLYKEDFARFVDSLQEVVDYIQDKQPEYANEELSTAPNSDEFDEELVEETTKVKDYTTVEFDDI